MTKAILILIAILCTPILKAETFSCATFPRSTNFSVHSTIGADKVQLVVQHSLGVENAPIFDGVVTGFTLDHMQKRLKLAQLIGPLIQADFKRDNCQFSEELVSCYSNEEKKLGQIDVQAYSFSAYKESTINPYGKFETYRVSFDYRVEGSTYDQTMEYLTTDCLYRD